ncbi:MAG: dihydroneopterin aldolase, partial [Chloroflexota bacterium]
LNPMDRILIVDLSARGIIGVNDWERVTPQEMLINIVLFADLRQAGESDDLAHSISYATVAERVRTHAESAARLTVEALAADIARLCLQQPGVQRAQVRVEKPGAVRFARSVGVEIERSRADFGLPG